MAEINGRITEVIRRSIVDEGLSNSQAAAILVRIRATLRLDPDDPLAVDDPHVQITTTRHNRTQR